MAVVASSSLFATASAAPLSEYLADSTAPTPIEYGRVGDRPLHLFMSRPDGLEKQDLRPAVLFIHGGAWTGGAPKIFFPHIRYFASRGLNAFSVEYPLLTPDGPTTMNDQIADCAAAVRYVRSHAAELNVDLHRIAVIGDSAGGHLAACLATTLTDDASRADAAVLFNPILDLCNAQWFKYAIGGKAIARNAPATVPTAGDLQRAADVSPIAHVAAGLPPILILRCHWWRTG